MRIVKYLCHYNLKLYHEVKVVVGHRLAVAFQFFSVKLTNIHFQIKKARRVYILHILITSLPLLYTNILGQRYDKNSKLYGRYLSYFDFKLTYVLFKTFFY